MTEQTITTLLRSKNPKVLALGVAIACFTLAPDIFRIAGNADLTVWERMEQYSLATGKFLLTIGTAAIPPEALVDKQP